MNDPATQLVELVEELVDELRHADVLITDQAERIAALEAEIAVLRNLIGPVAT
ncbi:MAG: hypothetical protein ACRD0C_15615 [Acidimicrobiia bacterium]